MVQQLRPRRRDGRFRSESENELEGDNKNYDDNDYCNDFDRIDDILHVQLNKYITVHCSAASWLDVVGTDSSDSHDTTIYYDRRKSGREKRKRANKP